MKTLLPLQPMLILLALATTASNAFLVDYPHHHSAERLLTSSHQKTHLYAVETQDNQPTTLAAQIASVFGKPDPIDHAVVTQRNKALVRTLKSLIFDTLYPDDMNAPIQRSYARFYALETIARQPYFAYLSVLHLLETLGKWRRVDLMTVHFAESHNELHHLLICESLGGNARFFDRWLAQHVAWFYYWIVCCLYLTNPATAYNLNQCVEEEAYHTYDTFLKRHHDYLQTQPAPAIAVQYYSSSTLFDVMHTGAGSSELEAPASARQHPVQLTTLYDTFSHMRQDEAEHARTMQLLQHRTPSHPM